MQHANQIPTLSKVTSQDHWVVAPALALVKRGIVL
jgi:hypothetical protein